MEISVMDTAQNVWSDCLGIVQNKINPLTYKTWFEPLIPTKLEGSLLTIEVPSTFFYEWLEEHYFALIQDALHTVIGPEGKLQYAVKVPKDDFINTRQSEIVRATETSNHRGSAHGNGANGKEHTFGLPPVRDTLNTKFTFDNFIRGDGNQFAAAASLNVANNPGETAFNPLVIYGGVGLGKTHLLQAIGNTVLQLKKGKRVCYVSSEQFTMDFVEAIGKNDTIAFSNYYRSMDVLVVDDIQFFSGKERTQDTFFHTFNFLHHLKKQIILSCDKAPKDLSGLDERLISRFQWGLTVDIQPPDLETRIAILKRKAEADRIDIPQNVIEYVASNVKSNIRELEGCYIGIVARHTLEQRTVDIDLAEMVIRNVVPSAKKDITVEAIQKIVADHFKVTENSLRAKTRKQEIVLPRQVAMYLAKKYTRASLKTIGLHFGGRDHSTIIHACRSIHDALDTDESMRIHLQQLEKQIGYLAA